MKKTFNVTLVRDGSVCFIPVPFDPKLVFGKVRAPVKVTLNGYTYRSTIASMGGEVCIPLRKSNREAAGIEGGETIDVRRENVKTEQLTGFLKKDSPTLRAGKPLIGPCRDGIPSFRRLPSKKVV